MWQETFESAKQLLEKIYLKFPMSAIYVLGTHSDEKDRRALGNMQEVQKVGSIEENT